MVKSLLKITGAGLILFFFAVPSAFMENGDVGSTAGGSSSPSSEPGTPSEATFQSRCASASAMNFPECADSPNECASEGKELGDKTIYREPFNCIYISEPIGGRPGYDLYKRTPIGDQAPYFLWYGEALVGNEQGPFQAILAYEEGKETEGPFSLLYNYLGLVYNFLSGLIIGFVILITVIGGVRMVVSAGDEQKYGEGKNMIIKALVGMILWFTASVILYTINPTFFAF